MAEITAAAVRELREKTGAGMMDCKKALEETDCDMEKAIDWLRKKGAATAAKRAGRAASEGVIESYVHSNGKLAVLVEVNCETDFVARNEDFVKFAKDLALHIAAEAPLYLRREDAAPEVLEREREVSRQTAKEQGKPDNIVDKMVEGRIEKYFAETVLLEQKFFRDATKSIQQLVTEMVQKMGENIQISRFVRLVLGEAAPQSAPESE